MTLLAVDGDVTTDVPDQLKLLPENTTHIFVSCGGNDAFRSASVLATPVKSVVEGLVLLNEIILEEGIKRNLPIIDLRVSCSELADYSNISPIEPSGTGGEKIVKAVRRVLAEHDYLSTNTRVYA